MRRLQAADLGIKLLDEERLTLTDNGVLDLEKKGIEGYYTWVGFRHGKGVNPSKMVRKMESFIYHTLIPAMIKKFHVEEDEICVENFVRQLDMFRVYVEVQG